MLSRLLPVLGVNHAREQGTVKVHDCHCLVDRQIHLSTFLLLGCRHKDMPKPDFFLALLETGKCSVDKVKQNSGLNSIPLAETLTRENSQQKCKHAGKCPS